jgi:hypothetical protein
MKLLLEAWRKFAADEPSVIPTREEMVDFLTNNPNQKIHLDSPKGSVKGLGRAKKIPLPFDYGEYPDIINPADNMGWDLIIVPSATQESELLLPVGHVEYEKDRRDKMGNDKIIIAPSRDYTEEDRSIIEDFFSNLKGFEPVRWY